MLLMMTQPKHNAVFLSGDDIAARACVIIAANPADAASAANAAAAGCARS